MQIICMEFFDFALSAKSKKRTLRVILLAKSKKRTLRVILLQKFLHVILRETLLKKGSPSNSLPKTFEFKFCP